LYFLRFKKEEVKIEAWEGRQRAKIEYEMRRIEVHTWLALLFENELNLAFLCLKFLPNFECNNLSYHVLNAAIPNATIFRI
jgi:hypothetical protein